MYIGTVHDEMTKASRALLAGERAGAEVFYLTCILGPRPGPDKPSALCTHQSV